MNVALTRAKSSVFILGNAATLERSDENWKAIVQDARQRSCFVDVRKFSAFRYHYPILTYPCTDGHLVLHLPRRWSAAAPARTQGRTQTALTSTSSCGSRRPRSKSIFQNLQTSLRCSLRHPNLGIHTTRVR